METKYYRGKISLSDCKKELNLYSTVFLKIKRSRLVFVNVTGLKIEGGGISLLAGERRAQRAKRQRDFVPLPPHSVEVPVVRRRWTRRKAHRRKKGRGGGGGIEKERKRRRRGKLKVAAG